MEIGPLLFTAEDRDQVVVDREVGQDVDRQVEPFSRAIAADGGRPNGHADEVPGLMFE